MVKLFHYIDLKAVLLASWYLFRNKASLVLSCITHLYLRQFGSNNPYGPQRPLDIHHLIIPYCRTFPAAKDNDLPLCPLTFWCLLAMLFRFVYWSYGQLRARLLCVQAKFNLNSILLESIYTSINVSLDLRCRFIPLRLIPPIIFVLALKWNDDYLLAMPILVLNPNPGHDPSFVNFKRPLALILIRVLPIRSVSVKTYFLLYINLSLYFFD